MIFDLDLSSDTDFWRLAYTLAALAATPWALYCLIHSVRTLWTLRQKGLNGRLWRAGVVWLACDLGYVLIAGSIAWVGTMAITGDLPRGSPLGLQVYFGIACVATIVSAISFAHRWSTMRGVLP